MVPNLDRIREVASKDQFMNEIKVFLDNLATQNKTKALYVARSLFFAPETHPRVRYMISKHLGKLGQKQLFQQLLSYFILHKFPDTRALISALGSFADPEALPALTDYFPQAQYRECLEIIDAVANTQAPETVELLSNVYNEQIEYVFDVSPEELDALRQKASQAMGKNIMRFDI